MRYTITGRNIEVTPGLKAAVEKKIGKLDLSIRRENSSARWIKMQSMCWYHEKMRWKAAI